MDICMESPSAKHGWEEIFKEFKVFLPDILPNTEPGKDFHRHPEDPVAILCRGCNICGVKQEEGFF